MNYEIFKFVLVAFIVLGILFFVLKSFIKAAIITCIIIILFRIGWTYTSNDLREKLFLDKIIDEKYVEEIYDKYDKYVEKRSNDGIINTEKLEETVKDEMNKKINEYKESINNNFNNR